MKAVVWHGIGDIRLDDVPDPKVEQPTDAVIRLTASAICGTDLHFMRGTFSGMKPGTILGHEGVVEALDADVRCNGRWSASPRPARSASSGPVPRRRRASRSARR